MYWYLWAEVIGIAISLTIAVRFIFSGIKTGISSFFVLSVSFISLSLALFFEFIGHFPFWTLEVARLFFCAFFALMIITLIPAMGFFRRLIEEKMSFKAVLYKTLCIIILFLRLTLATFDVRKNELIERTTIYLIVNGIDLDSLLVGIALFWLGLYIIRVALKQLKVVHSRKRRNLILVEICGVIIILLFNASTNIIIFLRMLEKNILMYVVLILNVFGCIILAIPYAIDPYITIILPYKLYGLLLSTRDGSRIFEVYITNEVKNVFPLISGLTMALNKIGEDIVDKFGAVEEIRFQGLTVVLGYSTYHICFLLAEKALQVHRDFLKKLCKEMSKLELQQVDIEKLPNEIKKIIKKEILNLFP